MYLLIFSCIFLYFLGVCFILSIRSNICNGYCSLDREKKLLVVIKWGGPVHHNGIMINDFLRINNHVIARHPYTSPCEEKTVPYYAPKSSQRGRAQKQKERKRSQNSRGRRKASSESHAQQQNSRAAKHAGHAKQPEHVKQQNTQSAQNSRTEKHAEHA